jgi:hypothetical protein
MSRLYKDIEITEQYINLNMNTNQHKFIEFVVENLLALNEAYGKAEVEKLVNKFKTQADALGIKGANGDDLTEDEIKAIINGFDQIRSTAASSIPTEKRDINRWNIKDLVRFVSEKINLEPEEEEKEKDKTPDMVYDDNNYTIWNGSKEGNCIKYGKGEKWCITRGSFSSYRYSQQRGYPVFYLVKNKSLSQTDALSFVAIQVRDKPEDERYVFTNRRNSPYESREMSWDELTSSIPWLTNIPDVKDKLKYIGVSNIEKKQRNWNSSSGLSEDQFDALSFNEKKAYLTARKNANYLIDNKTHSFFIKNLLPEYPELKKWIADFPFEFGFKSLIENFDEFTPAQQKSIAIKVNDIEHGGNDIFSGSFTEIGVKNIIKLLELNPNAFPPRNDRFIIGLVKIDGDNYIIRIDVRDDNTLDIEYFASTGFKNFKLNSYSEDALFNHPYIKNLPFEAIAKTIQSNNLSTKKVGGLLYKIQNPKEGEDNGGLDIMDSNGKKVLFDLNGIKPTVYDITGNKLSKIDINSEGNEEIKAKFKQLISTNDNLKVAIGRNIIASPQASFKMYTPNEIYSIFEDAPKEIYDQIISEQDYKRFPLFLENNTTVYFTRGIIDSNAQSRYWKESDINDFITSVKKTNYKFDDDAISQMISDQDRYVRDTQPLRSLLQNPEFQILQAQGNTYRYVVINNNIYRYNPNNLSDSNLYSKTSGRWIRGRVRPQDIGQQPTAQPAAAAAAGRRGRPAGATQAQQPAPAAPAATGQRIDNIFTTANLTNGFNSLPLGARRRLLQNGTTAVNVRGDRGSSGRQNQLGNSGRVTAAYSIDSGGQQPTKVYFITMASGAVIASINIQPGNYNYIVTPNGSFVVNNPRQLMAALQANNINEMKSFMIKNYLSLNPHQIDEVKAMLKSYTSNKKN